MLLGSPGRQFSCLQALDLNSVAIGIMQEEPVDPWDLVFGGPGEGIPCRLEMPRCGMHVFHPDTKVAGAFAVNSRLSEQMQTGGAHLEPGAWEVEALGAGDFVQVQQAAIKRLGSVHISDDDCDVIDSLCVDSGGHRADSTARFVDDPSQ
jgi:hypothetical protein